MAKRHYSEGEYAGEHMRRRQEMEDMGMIKEDRSAIANLPQEVMMKPWAKERNYMPEVLEDTIRGIDKQMSQDNHGRSKNFNNDERQF